MWADRRHQLYAQRRLGGAPRLSLRWLRERGRWPEQEAGLGREQAQPPQEAAIGNEALGRDIAGGRAGQERGPSAAMSPGCPIRAERAAVGFRGLMGSSPVAAAPPSVITPRRGSYGIHPDAGRGQFQRGVAGQLA